MKKLLTGTVLSALLMMFPLPSMAGVFVGFSFSLPPPIEFVAPPEVVVIPGTFVYGVPEVNVDLFFNDGFWWRLWEGRWYRSLNYDSGWSYYKGIPYFYRSVPYGWRNDYREHKWNGHPWTYQRVHYRELQHNWKTWKKNDHWAKPQPRPQPQHRVQAEKPHQYRQQPQHQIYTSHQYRPKPQQQPRLQPREPQPREVRPQQLREQPQSMNSHARQAPNSQQNRSQQARSERDNGNGRGHGRT